jgi:hypothetical protein
MSDKTGISETWQAGRGTNDYLRFAFHSYTIRPVLLYVPLKIPIGHGDDSSCVACSARKLQELIFVEVICCTCIETERIRNPEDERKKGVDSPERIRKSNEVRQLCD